MTTQSNTQAQSEQNSTVSINNLDVNFSHRLSEFSKIKDRLDITDDITTMTNRLLSILMLLSTQFDDDGGRLNDELILNAIDAARMECEDIKAVAIAWRHTEIEKQQAQRA